MRLREGRYRATTQVKGLSPEIFIISEVDTVHQGAGSSLTTATGEAVRTRLGLRPWRDTKRKQYELGIANVHLERVSIKPINGKIFKHISTLEVGLFHSIEEVPNKDREKGIAVMRRGGRETSARHRAGELR